MTDRRRLILGGLSALGLAACGELQKRPEPVAARVGRKPRIALALGGGAARGFAHIGVIKALETNGILPDIVVGTSAGSVVGALYAAGHGPFDLQKLAIQLDESSVTDWSLFDRGVIKGEALERFINTHVGNKPLEGLKRRFAAVATDLQSGEPIIFQRGNTGTAVRASSSIPGVFPPVAINGREYVDGGLVAPIPVREARSMGADLVIAVDISGRPSGKKNQGSVDVLLDTISIMGGALGKVELADADVVIRPELRGLPATNFQQRHEAILEGEKVGFAAVARVREAIAAWDKKNG
ncbi:patatin-like phospholipase family protein [Zoogloea dura]|uniref:Patatin-like phospholipase family protein n=1 Tax=Zoogloea dura TaxID=2728840 RepID=A0A848G689_9RHOO|nr:patatin-like phospholipase family protein [Zoogloea dura]NML26754.1 patatin-like phospholipase family protein [Zoogloea dura]